MKAIPMKGRLKRKRIKGFIWAGKGRSFHKKENYFQLEDDELVSAVLATNTGAFWFRCKGASCEVTMKDGKGRVRASALLTLPHGKRPAR